MPSIYDYSGQLVKKLAQDAELPGISDYVISTGGANTQAGRSSTAPTAPRGVPNTTGMVNTGQVLSGTATSMFGQIGGAAVTAILPFLQMANLVDPTKLHQVGYGGNVEAAQEAASVSKAVMPKRMEQIGKAVPQVIAGIGRRFGLAEQGDWLAGQILGAGDPSAIGMFVSQIYPALPVEAQQMFTAMAPQVLWDPTPLVNLSYRMSGNKPNPQLAASISKQFDQALAAGSFGGVPADAAANALYKASELMGGQVSMQHAISLTQAADQVVQSTGLRHADAVELLTASADPAILAKAVQNPAQLNNIVANSVQQYQAAGMNPEQFNGVLLAAKQQGVPLQLALNANAAGSRLSDSISGQKRELMSKGIADQRLALGTSATTQLLAAAYGRNPSSVMQVLKSGNQAALNSLLARAQRDPELMSLRKTVDTGDFLSKAMSVNPAAADMLTEYDANDFARRHGLERLLTNKNFATQFSQDPNRAMATAGLTARQREVLMSNQGRFLGHLASKAAPKAPAFKPRPATTGYPLAATDVKPRTDVKDAITGIFSGGSKPKT